MTRAGWLVLGGCLLVCGVAFWLIVPPPPAVGDPHVPVTYEAPTARDQRVYCEHERQEAPCQIGLWIACPPECDRYQDALLWLSTRKAEAIVRW
jgi:hypothetical protein